MTEKHHQHQCPSAVPTVVHSVPSAAAGAPGDRLRNRSGFGSALSEQASLCCAIQRCPKTEHMELRASNTLKCFSSQGEQQNKLNKEMPSHLLTTEPTFSRQCGSLTPSWKRLFSLRILEGRDQRTSCIYFAVQNKNQEHWMG